MNYPTKQELFEFFGAEAVEFDYVRVHTVQDATGVELALSYDIVADSLQTLIRIESRNLALISQEGMTVLQIAGDSLMAEFELDAYTINLQVKVRPFIYVEWGGLRSI